MSQTVTVAAALLVATLCTATATAVHFNQAGARAAAMDEARADLQRRAAELHMLALRDASGDASETFETEFKEPREVHAE